MKKQLCMIFTVCLAYGTITRAQLPAVDTGNAYVLGAFGLYRSWERVNGTTVYQPWSHQFAGVHWNGNTFENDEGVENFTTGSGQGSIHLGRAASPVLLNLKHNLTGRLYLYSNQNDIGNSVTMDASLNPESTITGSTSDRANISLSDNAITTFNGHTDGRNVTVNMTLTEGVYQGGNGHSGMVNVRNSGSLTIRGASFLAGAVDEDLVKIRVDDLEVRTLEPYMKYAAQAGAYVDIAGTLSIDNTDGDNFDRYQGASFTSASINEGGEQNIDINASGGDGLYAEASSVNITGGGEFIAGNSANNIERSVNYTGFGSLSANINARGGRGLVIRSTGNNSVEDAIIYGGQASSITVGGANARANSSGGEGLIANGTIDITNVYARAGNSASSTVVPEGYWEITAGSNEVAVMATSENATVYANGGSGIRLTGGNAEIWDSTAIGTFGSAANANGSNSAAYATGGHGILAQNTTLTINGGTYTGAKGGTVNVNGTGGANGGAGVYASIQKLTINGGTFTGGAGGRVNGVAQMGGFGVWADNASLEINDTMSDTLINGDVYFNNSSAKNLDILGGTIEGDILIDGSGKATVSIETDAQYSGTFSLMGGDADVEITDAAQGQKSLTRLRASSFPTSTLEPIIAHWPSPEPPRCLRLLDRYFHSKELTAPYLSQKALTYRKDQRLMPGLER
jgi:hypothetical protein